MKKLKNTKLFIAPNSTFPASPAGRYIPHSASGFTLIELLVVLFITTMIAGISVANFRAAEKQKRAVIAVDTVIGAIRNAQNYTLTGKNTNNASAACRVPLYYQITFAYTGAITLYGHNICGTDDLIETYSLPVNTRIKPAGMVLGGSTAVTSLSIVFTAPFGEMTAGKDGGANSTFATATITVETTDSTATKTATIDGVAGRIE